MRVLFFGTPDFASIVLRSLLSNQEVVGVLGKPGPVLDLAASAGVPILEQPIAADLFVTCAYGRILSEEQLVLSKLPPLNLHFSLLPQWRGAAPVARALLAGQEEMGVSIMRMVKALDAGPVCAQLSVDAGLQGYQELMSSLATQGARLLQETLPRIADGSAVWREQDDSQATYAAKLRKGELDLDRALPALQNLRRVRASSDSTPAKCHIGGRGVRILQAALPPSPDAEVGAGEGAPATLSRRKHLLLDCADGLLEVLRLKPDGGKAISGRDFLNGLRGQDFDWE